MYSNKGERNVCLLCNGSLRVSARKCCPIFEYRTSTTQRTVLNLVNSVVGFDISSSNLHSSVVCKNCFKVCDEFDNLENKLKKLKAKISNAYEKTALLNGVVPREVFVNAVNTNEVLKRPRGRPKKHEINDGQRIVENADDNLIEVVYPDNDNLCDSGNNHDIIDSEIIEIDNDNFIIEDYVLDDASNVGNDLLIKNEPAEEKKPQIIRTTVLIPQLAVGRVTIDGERKYKCLVCTVQNLFISDATGIIKHLKELHDRSLFICDVCHQLYFKRRELTKHMNGHVQNGQVHECNVCKRVFTDFRLCRIHKKMHKPQPKNFPCDICGKRYGSRNVLEEHKNMHTGKRPHSCSTCGKCFTSKYTLKSHQKTHIARPRPYKCINCGKSFLTQQNLIHHERIHSGITSYICKECGKSFKTARNLEKHCIIHTGYKPHICRLCGKAFSKKTEIRDHERTHTGEKPYQCEFCGAAFGQRSNLQTHKKTTHYDEKRYKCTDCGRAFKRRRLLDYHMKAAHTGERPYKCEECAATFIYPEHFKKHKLIHTGAKPYKCEVCGKAFNSRDNRNAHRFVHSDKKPYECPICGAGFMRKPLLYNHMNMEGHQHETIIVNQPKLSLVRCKAQAAGASNAIASDRDAAPSTSAMVKSMTIEDDGVETAASTSHIQMDLYSDVDDDQEILSTAVNYECKEEFGSFECKQEFDNYENKEEFGSHMLTDNHLEITNDNTISNGYQILQIRLDTEEDRKRWIDIMAGQHLS